MKRRWVDGENRRWSGRWGQEVCWYVGVEYGQEIVQRGKI